MRLVFRGVRGEMEKMLQISERGIKFNESKQKGPTLNERNLHSFGHKSSWQVLLFSGEEKCLLSEPPTQYQFRAYIFYFFIKNSIKNYRLCLLPLCLFRVTQNVCGGTSTKINFASRHRKPFEIIHENEKSFCFAFVSRLCRFLSTFSFSSALRCSRK